MKQTPGITLGDAGTLTHPTRRSVAFRSLVLAALASSALLAMAYFPLNWGWLGWVAWVPFGLLVRSPRVPGLYRIAWAAFVPHFLLVLWWLSVANWFMTFAWILMAFYGTLTIPIVLTVLRWLDRRTLWPLTWTLPITLVLVEWVRGNLIGGMVSLVSGSYQHDLPGGFAWYLLGHTQHDFPEVIQIADLGGAYAVSFVVAAVNGVLFETLAKYAGTFVGSGSSIRPARPQTLLIQGVAVLALLIATLGYGLWQTRRETMRPGPTVALLQGSIPQAARDRAHADAGVHGQQLRESQLEHYRRLCDLAWREKPDLIVWPETSYPGLWQQERGGDPFPPFRRLADSLLRAIPTAHLVGMNTLEVGNGPTDGVDREYNSALYFLPGQGLVSRYDKIHRVPFGEYVPLGDWLGFLRGVGPNSGEYGIAPGRSFSRFTLPAGQRFGVLICYEDSVPRIAAAYCADPLSPGLLRGRSKAEHGRDDEKAVAVAQASGAEVPPSVGVDFLVNISNDGWWDGTFGHDQHLAVCRFRAVECRRPLVRAVNMGISAMIDANGRVRTPRETAAGNLALWSVPDNATSLPSSGWYAFRVRPGVIVGRVLLDNRQSVYARWGDWLVLLCGLTFVVVMVTVRRGPNDDRDFAHPVIA